MKGTRLLSVTIALATLLALAVGLSAAQGPAFQERDSLRVTAGETTTAPSAGEPGAALGTGFIYQGQLLDNSIPVNDTCNLRFNLYNDPFGGSLVAGPLDLTGVSIIAGRFTVLLDFGAIFQGEVYWLEVAVKCTGDPSYVTMDPRSGLTAAPYALSLQPGAVISGTVSGSVLTAINQNEYGYALVGLQPGYDPYDMGGFWEPAGLFGGKNGVIGYSQEPDGYGVIGYANTSSGTGHGVHGVSESPSGAGVYGWNIASGGPAHGVYGKSSASSGIGVEGYASGPGGSMGVFGQSASPDGLGVYGWVGATAGTAAGVYGISYADHGRGVSGRSYASTGPTVGVYGESDSPNGWGVWYEGGIGGHGLQSTSVATPDHGWRNLYNGASTKPIFEDLGSAQLVDGRAEVTIDPVFAQTVNLSADYYVFTTALSDEPVVLYVSEKSAASFILQAVTLDGRPAQCTVDYRIVAKRLGYEDMRLSPATFPASPENELGGGE
jgi:hypothetical protein